MELYIPTDWLVGGVAGIALGAIVFFLGTLIGTRRERKKWLAFIEAQCRMSLAHSEDNPVEAALAEREKARERRLLRRDER